ncbi:hypothetical protein [Sphingobacterium lactis]|uniref:Uncharacterized protein n=1 Tax=Sphingobacterium lactis TaxID=797291 RepID=A0A1H6A080_9SPHI|nr:hypothetical protein [Sphingobacterium lactis]SEG41126.1 hypothetical protein SAMN05421877_107235 [Sphingobacterium lactis]
MFIYIQKIKNQKIFKKYELGKTNERLPEANNDIHVVLVTKVNFTFLAVGLYMRLENKWYYMDKGRPSDLVIENVNVWVENIGLHLTF